MAQQHERHTMKTLGNLLLITAGAFVITAIWTPYHWQSALTAIVALIAAAAILGNKPSKGIYGTHVYTGHAKEEDK